MKAAPATARPRDLLARLEPYLVAHRPRFGHLDLAPLGQAVPPANRYEVLRPSTRRFLDRLVRLDRHTFGPEGMPMPAWLFVDGSALPGVIAGLGIRAGALEPAHLERLDVVAEPDELVPLAMYIAVPTRPPHVWYGHNLASLKTLLPELGLHGLGRVTKSLGLAAMRCTEQLGATQWSSNALHVHTRFGPLELLSAWTPAHSDPATLTYRLRLAAGALDTVVEGGRVRVGLAPDLAIDPEDGPSLQQLERRIEHGERFAIVGPPEHRADGSRRVPVATLAAATASRAG